MAARAECLPVAIAVPEEHLIASVWHDVVDHRGRRDDSAIVTAGEEGGVGPGAPPAYRMLAEEMRAGFDPACIVATIVSRTTHAISM